MTHQFSSEEAARRWVDGTTKESELDTTIDEWRAEIERLNSNSDDKGKTTTELARELGVSERTMQRQIKLLIENGRCRPGIAKRRTMKGYYFPVPVYQLIPEKKADKQ